MMQLFAVCLDWNLIGSDNLYIPLWTQINEDIGIIFTVSFNSRRWPYQTFASHASGDDVFSTSLCARCTTVTSGAARTSPSCPRPCLTLTAMSTTRVSPNCPLREVLVIQLTDLGTSCDSHQRCVRRGEIRGHWRTFPFYNLDFDQFDRI